MKTIKNISYNELQLLQNKNVHFISDCEFFPNFDIKAKVLSYKTITNNEILLYTKVLSNNKILIISSNMKNLSYEIL